MIRFYWERLWQCDDGHASVGHAATCLCLPFPKEHGGRQRWWRWRTSVRQARARKGRGRDQQARAREGLMGKRPRCNPPQPRQTSSWRHREEQAELATQQLTRRLTRELMEAPRGHASQSRKGVRAENVGGRTPWCSTGSTAHLPRGRTGAYGRGSRSDSEPQRDDNLILYLYVVNFSVVVASRLRAAGAARARMYTKLNSQPVDLSCGVEYKKMFVNQRTSRCSSRTPTLPKISCASYDIANRTTKSRNPTISRPPRQYRTNRRVVMQMLSRIRAVVERECVCCEQFDPKG